MWPAQDGSTRQSASSHDVQLWACLNPRFVSKSIETYNRWIETQIIELHVIGRRAIRFDCSFDHGILCATQMDLFAVSPGRIQRTSPMGEVASTLLDAIV